MGLAMGLVMEFNQDATASLAHSYPILHAVDKTCTGLLLGSTCCLDSKASAQDIMILRPDMMQLLLLSHISNGFFGLLVEGHHSWQRVGAVQVTHRQDMMPDGVNVIQHQMRDASVAWQPIICLQVLVPYIAAQ